MTEKEKKKKKAEYDKEYRAKNKERIANRHKEWYDQNKEKKRLYDIEYRKNNAKKKKEVKANWNKKNKEKMSEYNKEYYSTPDGLAKRRRNHYLADDRDKGFDTAQTITAKWIVENIFTGHCLYCGDDDFRHLGCDRIDETKGHTKENIVCACPVCNWERSLQKLSVEEFIEYRKTHPRFKKKMDDDIDRKTGERKPLKKKPTPGLIF